MTGATLAAREGTRPSNDLRPHTRWLAALLIPVGPAAVAVLRYVLPYSTVDEPATIVGKVIADPASQSLVLWMAFVAALTIVPGVLWVGRLTRRGAPRLTAAAMLLMVPGYLALGWLCAGDALLLAGARSGIGEATLTSLFGTLHPTIAIAEVMFVIGHVIGTVLLGIAMWRSHAVPRWAAVAVAISQPLHFVAAIIVASPELDLAAWGMNAVGFAAASAAISRLSDEAWDSRTA